MIISTGMRTDIPAFYSKWFMNRIREGFVYVRNPYYKEQIIKYSLNPNVVDGITFCTKNPNPMLDNLDELKEKYNMFWFVTITPYGKDLEPNVPDKKQIIESLKKLSEKLGKHAVALRYDPILLNKDWTIDRHIKAFKKLIEQIKDYITDVTISFLDMYETVKNNAPEIRTLTELEQREIGKAFSKIAKENQLQLHACCEREFLKEYGIDVAGCQSQKVIEKAFNEKLNVKERKSQRLTCNCLLGRDIGEYNTCMHLCKYCYANAHSNLVKENVRKHNCNSPLLIGNFKEVDNIKEAKQISWKTYKQESLF